MLCYEDVCDLHMFIKTLPIRNQKIIKMRYWLNMANSDIGKEFNISGCTVYKILRDVAFQYRRRVYKGYKALESMDKFVMQDPIEPDEPLTVLGKYGAPISMVLEHNGETRAVILKRVGRTARCEEYYELVDSFDVSIGKISNVKRAKMVRLQ